MAPQRTICVFAGAGFSKAIFGQKIQNCFTNDLIKYQVSRQFLSADLVRLLKEIQDVELVMSHFHNLAHSGQSTDNRNQYQNIRDIIFVRTAIAVYLRDKFHDLTSEYNNQELIKSFFKQNYITKDNVFFVTTNYDLGIEKMLGDLFGDGAYYYPGSAFSKQVSSAAGIPIFKLHGSINWMEKRGESSDSSFTNKFRDNLEIKTSILESLKPTPFPHSHTLCLQHTDGNKYTPILIPFFYQKQEWLSQNRAWKLLFTETWKRAQSHMQTADRIFFWGYSLPAADHYLFTFLFKIIWPKNLNCIVVDKSTSKPLNTTLAKMLHYCYLGKEHLYHEHYDGLIEFFKNNRT
jgi:hypothetical protein